ncbi:MAG: HAD family phosphatase [Gammaproteobacteria bacterium]|nr:HAD family phosphatase [Gammaproteobacteria bacterium]
MNIVFDLGGVVFNWQPDKLIKSVFDNAETQRLVKVQIFEHPDWVELDKGTLDVEQAIERGALRTQLPRTEISKLMSEVPRSLTPIHESIDLLHSIRGTDNRLFVLSNMQFPSIEHLERESSIWDLFDGIVISCRIQKVKPDIEIYQYLLKEHRLVAEETVFIDDTDVNLVAAASLGINTIKFVSSSQCRQDLVDLKCISTNQDTHQSVSNKSGHPLTDEKSAKSQDIHKK